MLSQTTENCARWSILNTGASRPGDSAGCQRQILIPSLPERREDIPPLVEHFLDLRQQEAGKQGLRMSDEAWALLLGYHWPGNVREVESWSHRLSALVANGEEIGPE